MKLDMVMLRESQRSWWDSSGRRVGPAWLQWLWTLLFCAVLAVGFTGLGYFAFSRGSGGAWADLSRWGELYLRNLVVCCTIGGLIHLSFDIAGWLMGGLQRVRAWAPWQRNLFFTAIPMAGTAVGWPLGMWLQGTELQRWTSGPQGTNTIVGNVLLALVLTWVFHQFFAIKSRQIEAERQATEAQLRLLQGQIEPHFLFNTLANVQALMDHDLGKAKQMLGAFTDYLRASLTQLRRDDSELGLELDLAEAYLSLLQGRMEERLTYRITAETAARGVLLPPLLLQPLVENAVVHGLESQLEGGHVHVHARVQDGYLVVEVSDNGRGLDAAPRTGARPGQANNGVALSNIRQRLLSRYGGQATLTLQDTAPGTRCTLRLPVPAAEPTRIAAKVST